MEGSFWPSYILCRSFTTSEKRSGYRIVKMFEGMPASKLPRVLFTEVVGHEDMIGFMSSYQCQDSKGKHYHPHGYLCWYECNRYGDPTGQVIPIKRVPEYVWIFDFSNKGYQKLKKDQSKVWRLSEVIAKEPRASPLETSEVKFRLAQRTKRRSKKR